MTPHPVAVVALSIAATGIELAFVEEAIRALSSLAGADAWTSGTFLFTVPTLLLVIAGSLVVGGLLSELWHRRLAAELARREAALEARRQVVTDAVIDLFAATSLRDWPDATWRQLARIHGELTGIAPLAGVPRPPDDSLPWEEA